MEGIQNNKNVDDLLKLCISNKKAFDKVLFDQLASCNNPYLLIIQCMKKCPRLNKPKTDYQSSAFLKVLERFKKDKVDQENFQEYIDECILNDLLDIIPKIKSNEIQKLIIDTFGLKDMEYEKRSKFEPVIKEMIALEQYKVACSLISMLRLHEQFNTQPLIVPLFLLYNDLGIVENFINESPEHQKEFVMVLDNLFGIKGYYDILVQEYGIENKSIAKTKAKNYSTMATKLLKKYNLDISHCPHILNKRMSGSLHFIYTKFYEERSIQRSTFYSLIHDTVKDNPQMQKLMITFFGEFRDVNAALPYINKYQVPVATLPKKIKSEYLKYSPKEIENFNFLADNGVEEVIETWEYSFPEYYPLKLSKNDVSIVETIEEFVSCMDAASKATTIAIDAEWKPSFGLGGGDEDMGLLQLAFDNQAFLIDFITLFPLLEETHWIMLINIFQNENITKLGFGFDNDLKILKTMNPTMRAKLVNEKNILDLMDFKNYLMMQCPKIFKYNNMNNKGLSGMVCQCFGQPLNKLEQFSNWSARPLTVGQIKYAAQDAQCLIDIYDYLEESYKSCGLPDWKIKLPIKENKTQAHQAGNPMASRLGKMPFKNRQSTSIGGRVNNSPMTKSPKKTADPRRYVPASKYRAACDSGVQHSYNDQEGYGRNERYQQQQTYNIPVLNSGSIPVQEGYGRKERYQRFRSPNRSDNHGYYPNPKRYHGSGGQYNSGNSFNFNSGSYLSSGRYIGPMN